MTAYDPYLRGPFPVASMAWMLRRRSYGSEEWWTTILRLPSASFL